MNGLKGSAMLDGMMRGVIDAPLTQGGRWLASRGATANAITLVGLAVGLGAAALLAFGWSGLLVAMLVLASRLADGLDGAVARARGKTDLGGYLDIVCDFGFYGAIPLAFVLQDPVGNGVVGAFLLFSFYLNAATFLGFAIVAERRGMVTQARGEKSLYFTAGLMEGTETILFILVVVLWPIMFQPLAWILGALCIVTAIGRLILAIRVFG